MKRGAAALIVAVGVLIGVPAWPVTAVASEGILAEVVNGPLASSGVPSAFRLLSAEPPFTAGDKAEDIPDLTLNGRGHATDAAEHPAATTRQERHWSGLPFLGDKAREAGYDLPWPFGVSVLYNYLDRDVEVTDVRVGVDGAPLGSVTDVASFKARSIVHAAVVKPDVWIFSFLNVYALLGYIWNSTDVNVRVTVPSLRPSGQSRQFTIKATTELEGFVGGGGLILAGGYREFFVAADVNYSQTELGFDDRFRALVVSARTGWNGKVGAIPLRLWAGAAYWDTENTAKDTVAIEGVGSVRFEADQGPKHPWNAVVGVSSALHRHLEIFTEYGFNANDVTIFVGGLTIRF